MRIGSVCWRRILGIAFLLLSGGLLLLGLTVLKPKLDGAAFLIYWFACFLFTFAAMIVALLDVQAIRRQSAEETRRVFERSLANLEREASSPPIDRNGAVQSENPLTKRVAGKNELPDGI
jgi:hypothetical protein